MCRYDNVAQSFPVLVGRAGEQVQFALEQSLGFLKSQVLVCPASRMRTLCIVLGGVLLGVCVVYGCVVLFGEGVGCRWVVGWC